MTWGGLNNALTAWRRAVLKRFPGKDNESDGARADAAHGANSQHQADADSTVDAYDMDVNVLDSGVPTGSPEERRLIEAMKLDFEEDPYARGQLWISYREIANRDIGRWRERDYGGPSPHDHHVHWESVQAREDDGRDWPMPHTDALLREMRGDDVDEADIEAIADRVIAKLTKVLATAESPDVPDHSIVRNLIRIPWQYPGKLEQLKAVEDGVAELLTRVPDPTPAQQVGKQR